MTGTHVDMSHSALEFLAGIRPGLSVNRLGPPGEAPLVDGGAAFGVGTDAEWVDGANGTVLGHDETPGEDGATTHVVRTRAGKVLLVDWHVRTYAGTPVVEVWPVVRNAGDGPVVVRRVDSFSIDMPAASDHQLLSFHAAGSCEEFAPRSETLAGTSHRLESVSGRSSHGAHPWFAVRAADGRYLVGCVAWSGNWAVRFDPLPGGGYRLCGGLHEEGFEKRLLPGADLTGPRVVLVPGSGDLAAASSALTDVGRAHWYPPVDADFPPTEWNHWWPYVDHLDEKTFLANVEAAADLGLELCTLDAGWYGLPDPDAPWYAHRGDWASVNSARFPGGLRSLADAVHARGMKFGLWCEIEGLGEKALLSQERPDLPATRAGVPLGYVCLANPAGRTWATAVLDRLIGEYACDWVKLDFNVDPGLGCDRTDHGHGAGDGLYEHYVGYYAMLDDLRGRHPSVVLENCSSGGLRIDLEMARHTHLSYISDPDWPEHSLQVFWGALTSLAPDRCLHWAYSQWWDPRALPHQHFDPADPDLSEARLDYYVRISMLHGFGLSQKLPDLPRWVADRYRDHIRVYKEVVRDFVRDARVTPLTGQPEREGEGDRWAAFQYSLPGDRDHLLFVFRLDGSEPRRTLLPHRLDPARRYLVRSLASGAAELRGGEDLTRDGLLFADLAEQESELLRIVDAGPC